MRVGDIEIVPLSDGTARSPVSVSYPGTTDADWAPHRRWLTDDGMLQMEIGCFLLRSGDRTLLVDAGLGTAQARGFDGGKLLDDFAAHGVRPDEVTDVVFTHLHFDHVGWATQQGRVIFTNATYRCHEADWMHFVGADGSGGAGRKLLPVRDRLLTWDGAATIAPGVDVLPSPGHTPGHSCVVVSSGTERAILLGDAAHCPAELEEAEWDGLADVDPALAKRTREALARELESSGTPAAAAHFPGLQFGRLLRADGRAQWVS